MKQALVTGGCGFLGSSIVRSLLDRGVGVRVLALPQEPTSNVDGLEVEVVRGDIMSVDDCRASVAGVDTVFHAAAIYKAWMPDPTKMYEVNDSGTFNVLSAAREAGVAKIVYTASIVSIGRPEPGRLADEQTPYEAWDIDFPYSRAKYHSREIAEDFARWGLDVRVVCPGIVLGPRDIVPTPSGQLIVDVLAGDNPPVYVDGGANYVDVRDVAEVHALAAERGRSGERYLATGTNLRNLEFLQTINRVAGRSRRYHRIPTRVAQAFVNAMEAQARRTGTPPPMTRNFLDYSLKPGFFTNAKAVRELGATFRPVDDTIRDAIAWFRERGMLRDGP